MKIIITENQLKDIAIERYAKIFDKIVSIKYPKLYQNTIENEATKTVKYYFWDSYGENELIFYTDEDNDFKVSITLLEKIYDIIGLDFFNVKKINVRSLENRKIFNEIMKRYARKYLGISVNDVWLGVR